MANSQGIETTREIYIVDGSRTPFLKARGKPGPFAAADLAVGTCRSLLSRQSFTPSDLEEVVAGCIIPSADEANIARIIALRLGCGNNVPGVTVQRNCGSGMQGLDTAMQLIASGRNDLILAGGTEAMSHAPLVYGRAMVDWFSMWYAAKSIADKLKVAGRFKPKYLAPVISLLRGLRDPVVGLSMGQTAENLGYRFGITRQQMDDYSVNSHLRLAQAQSKGYLSEVTPIYDYDGNHYDFDDGVRADSSLEKLAKLKPVFDKKYGMVTAGNSSQVSDGAAFLILASEDAVKKYKLPVMGRIIDVNWAALDPAEMGLGPVHAIVPLLQKHKLSIKDIDYWEINEAFAAQVLACLHAFNDNDYCKQHFGLSKAFGEIAMTRLNVDGGAIAIGHPIGTSGARLVLHLLHVLERKKAKRGVASMCIGGGQGGAMIIELGNKD